MEINHSLMLCSRDIESMWRNGMPLDKAIRHMQYLLVPREVQAAKRDLRRAQNKRRQQYNWYKADAIDKTLHKAAR